MKKISIGVLISALSAWGLTAAETVYTVDNANTIGFYNAQVNIGRIDIVQTGTTGRMRIEQPNGVYNVTNGIHLADGARLSYWAGKSTAGVFGGGGVRVVNTTVWSAKATGSKALAPGWHRWEVRVHDGSGGWGVVASVNGNNALSYIAPGANGEEKQFNEVNLKLAATLGDIAVLEPTGVYKELELGEGATLTSNGSMAMPIFGTLKGNGTLAGPFAFAGDHNAWAVEGVGNLRDLTSCAKFGDATAATFAGLKCVKATFAKYPPVFGA